ncbi:SHOCT domain-containing protein [Herminiimonas fonticola]|uniref:Putative membrane protein n=1 Tax=Herminiimonas fonticola TaxID=303380 RepID=A0A4R6FZW8_9BURK|nr:SHOCT domain-containing protein [Herminiimonas fonticola]TDN87467.1 putative membrane protein [Herminiimonas fonticola]
MYSWHAWDWGCGAGGIMGFGMLLVWLVPIGLIVALVMLVNRRNATPPQSERAIDILEKAYARGEITRDEFLAKRNDLSEKRETSS